MDIGSSIPSNSKSAELMEPTERSFDEPALLYVTTNRHLLSEFSTLRCHLNGQTLVLIVFRRQNRGMSTAARK